MFEKLVKKFKKEKCDELIKSRNKYQLAKLQNPQYFIKELSKRISMKPRMKELQDFKEDDLATFK